MSDDEPQVRLAKKIRIERNGSSDYGHIVIDGEPFLYATQNGPSVHVSKAPKLPGITVTIVAESVEVADNLYAAKPAESDEENP